MVLEGRVNRYINMSYSHTDKTVDFKHLHLASKLDDFIFHLKIK